MTKIGWFVIKAIKLGDCIVCSEQGQREMNSAYIYYVHNYIEARAISVGQISFPHGPFITVWRLEPTSVPHIATVWACVG